MSGQTDRERAADLMAGGANAFKDYMFFSDEQDRSSFPRPTTYHTMHALWRANHHFADEADQGRQAS